MPAFQTFGCILRYSLEQFEDQEVKVYASLDLQLSSVLLFSEASYADKSANDLAEMLLEA